MNPELHNRSKYELQVEYSRRFNRPMPIDEHWCWLCAIIARRLIEMNLDIPSLVPRRDSGTFEYDTLMYLMFSYAKPLRGYCECANKTSK